MYSTQNILLIIVGIIVIVGIIYLIYRDTHKAIPLKETFNQESFSVMDGQQNRKYYRPSSNTDTINEMSDSIVDELLTDYRNGLSEMRQNYRTNDIEENIDIDIDDECQDIYSPVNSSTRLGINPADFEPRRKNGSKDFTHNKNKFTLKTPQDIRDEFDVQQLLPQEEEEGWFEPITNRNTERVSSTNLIHPKTLKGINTVGASMKNPSIDIRGDIYVPKRDVGPFGNSSYEPNLTRGLCG